VRSVVATLVHHAMRVIFTRSNKQMVRIHTEWDIAVVANSKTRGDNPNMNLVGVPMSWLSSGTYSKTSVAVPSYRTLPNPTKGLVASI